MAWFALAWQKVPIEKSYKVCEPIQSAYLACSCKLRTPTTGGQGCKIVKRGKDV